MIENTYPKMVPKYFNSFYNADYLDFKDYCEEIFHNEYVVFLNTNL